MTVSIEVKVDPRSSGSTVNFCQQERDERDEFGLAVAVPSNDVVKTTQTFPSN